MFKSIAQDISSSFDYGNMVVKLIIINVAVFVLTALTEAFFPVFYMSNILPYIALPGDFMTLIYRPWTLITHMFVHSGLWHLAWNMITLYWFGNIAGDLLGDRRILPVYILGGLMGAVFYIVSFTFLSGIGVMALGASAAVLAVVFTAVSVAPDYVVHLILIGPVRIKYIGLIIFFIDLIGTRSGDNTGGHIAHLGGTLFGIFFVYLLRSGIDISKIFSADKSKFIKSNRSPLYTKSKLKIAHKAETILKKIHPDTENKPISLKVDEILDKIKSSGYDSLTAEEKEILYQASKS
ncbi:MAG: rhomboid family intramembrane serine protease [Saprospiraceae bacterium]|jgi:membrane associated rhomboid family serine protease|nr:rhomboid family intramembrane serine protease [Saprospiraceae bacterium]